MTATKQLPGLTAVVEFPINRTRVVLFALLAALFLWPGLGAALHTAGVAYPWRWALLPSLAVVGAAAYRTLAAPFYMRLGEHGLEHFRLGRIAWSDVAGIRIQSIEAQITQRFLVLMVTRPEAYVSRLGALWQVIHRRNLLKKQILTFPLLLARADPAELFEAAVRLRSKLAPPAITGWDGDRKPLSPYFNTWTANPPDPLKPEDMDLRIPTMITAASGGWTQFDTLDMALRRIELAALNASRSDAIGRVLTRELEARDRTGDFSNLDLQGVQDRAEAAFAASAEGRRHRQLQDELAEEVKKRASRQKVLLYIVIAMFAALYIAAKVYGPMD